MTIYRGPGGGGNADSDAEIDALTLLSTQTLAYSEIAGSEADAAAVSAAAASTSAASAATSASNASTSASSASTSASSASTSATNAASSASSASTSASAASTSATNAASSASAASTSATNAASSATAAASSATSAASSATSAAGNATTATTQASNAATSATTATTQAGIATTGAGTATTQASNAATSASNASNSATSAATSATNAAASATAAAASVASIDLPTIVRTTGNQTIGGTKTFSSTIVGSVNGNAATVTTNANLTGDVTSVGNATTLSNTAVTAGSYTLSNITVDAKGRITAASSGSPSGGVSSFSAGTTGFTPNTATTGAVTLAGTLAISNGGTGQTTRQNAMDALAGAVTSGQYLRGNGTDVVMSAIQAADVPTLNQNTTGNAATATTATNQSGGTVSATSITDSGNLTFTGTGNRITGDFSNATVANRVLFQTSTTNGQSNLNVIPNGTGNASIAQIFNGSDPINSSWLLAAAYPGTISIQSGQTGTGTYLPMTMWTGGSERVRVDTSGNVGIGTSSPGSKLDVTGTIGAVNVSSSTGTNHVKVQVNNTGGSFQFAIENSAGSNFGAPAYSRVLWNDGAYPTVFYTSSAERMRIDSSGNVGIGKTAPTTKLDVTGTVTATSFSGAGTGLTGTAASLSIGGNATNLSTNNTNWSTQGTISAVVGQLAWKNYGNNHTIFDASQGTAPSGAAVNNTNSAAPWTGSYPTLMGWNGTQTYGVRVDTARVSESCSGNAATATTAISRGTAVSVSGTSVSFTGIPSTVKRISLMFNFVSTNGSSNYLMQLGTGGTATTSGYVSASGRVYSGVNVNTSTAGFILGWDSAAFVCQGSITFENITGNTWVASGTVSSTASTPLAILVGGTVSLGGVLDMLRLTTVNGTDAFDAGQINILYE